MIKHYFSRALSFVLAVLICQAISAQNKNGNVYAGYAQYDDYIYEYDGVSLPFNARVGAAVLLTPDMLKPYVGGTIVGMRAGWGTSEMKGTYEAFVRARFDSEDLSTGKGTVSFSWSNANNGYGWNTINLSEYVIPEDVDTLIAGFFTNIKANVYAIPTLYPHNVENSNYLYIASEGVQGASPDILDTWTDMSETGILPILLVIRDKEGTFNNVAAFSFVNTEPMATQEDLISAVVRMKNLGSQPVRNIEVTTTLGEKQYSQTVNLSSAVAASRTSGVFMAPLYVFGTGEHKFTITKVNGQPNKAADQAAVLPLVSIPDEVAESYDRRPLVEYFVSENSYMYPRYYDEYVAPGMRNYKDKVTFVCQHLDDQFMTGDDDATRMYLDFVYNDSSKVSIPKFSFDRTLHTGNISFQRTEATNPLFDTLLPDFVGGAYDAALSLPTFAHVEAEGEIDEAAENVSVSVSGDVAPGILPEGEKARLTVYLMERDVESDSQIFWTDEEKIEKMGHYTHPNLIREVLTEGIYGEPIESAEDGSFQRTFQLALAPEWNMSHLYVVAFVNRQEKNGSLHRNVLNSCEGAIELPESLSAISTAAQLHQRTTAYDLQGRRIGSAPAHGVFIVNGKKVVR